MKVKVRFALRTKPICTFLHLPQEKSAPSRTFFQRTDKLAARMGMNVQDLPEIIRISRRTLFECRSADSAVTNRTWHKLEEAERAAGIIPSPTDSHWMHPENAESEGKVKEDKMPYRVKRVKDVAETATLLEVLTRIAEALEGIERKMKD